KMQKLGFPTMKSLDQFKSSLDQFKSLPGSVTGAAKNFTFASRSSSDSNSLGCFANLKLTAEKLVKEQASVKTDLEMANAKLRRSMEHIRALEEKLQNAFNENAKLKVKQKEDEKLWKGLESKFSSTRTLCDQLTETLQHLAGQVQDAEKDKKYFESKLSASSEAFDRLNEQMNGLSLKLGSAEETICISEKELDQLKIERDEKDKFHRVEQCRTANLIEEKDAMIKKFEAAVAANRQATESLTSKLEEVLHELKVKEDDIRSLMANQENLEKEKSILQLSNADCAKKLDMSLQEIKHLENFVQVLTVQMVELDKQSLTYLDKFDRLNSLYDSCFKLAKRERYLLANHAQEQYDQLHDKLLCITSEKDALQLVNQELNSKITALQKAQESVMAQLSEECRSARANIQSLEAEAETLVSKKIATEMLISKLEEKIDTLSESSRISENKMQDLLSKISALEFENNDNTEKLQAEIQKKEEEIDDLQKEKEKHELRVDSLEKQIVELENILEEKEQLILQYNDREKKLEDQSTENQALLSAAESELAEAKKQYDQMLESKQLELSRHLKEISLRNDQAINDIRMKYEVEKQEIINMEKEKADKVVGDMESKCDKKLAECEEESRSYLMRVQEENAALVSRLQLDHDRRELNLKAEHSEELKRAELQAEKELREKTKSLRNEHEAQMKALRCEHEDECRKLQEELDLQKSKEDRQRALLQLQWKVMGNKPQEDQEMNSKRDYSVSSIKRRDSGGVKRSQHAWVRPEDEEKDSPFLEATQTPVSKMLKKVETANTGSVVNIPKHHKKVTHHKYEVETNNGRTITKRKKTKSTVMFEDPRKHRKNTPEATPRSAAKGTKRGVHPHPSNIGDLFSE
ncbi:hypothetical protein CFOL_v3_07085, partial [Cephalotus follicularis]